MATYHEQKLYEKSEGANMTPTHPGYWLHWYWLCGLNLFLVQSEAGGLYVERYGQRMPVARIHGCWLCPVVEPKTVGWN